MKVSEFPKIKLNELELDKWYIIISSYLILFKHSHLNISTTQIIGKCYNGITTDVLNCRCSTGMIHTIKPDDKIIKVDPYNLPDELVDCLNNYDTFVLKQFNDEV